MPTRFHSIHSICHITTRLQHVNTNCSKFYQCTSTCGRLYVPTFSKCEAPDLLFPGNSGWDLIDDVNQGNSFGEQCPPTLLKLPYSQEFAGNMQLRKQYKWSVLWYKWHGVCVTSIACKDFFCVNAITTSMCLFKSISQYLQSKQKYIKNTSCIFL